VRLTVGILATIIVAQVLTWAFLGKRALATQVGEITATLPPFPNPHTDCAKGLLIDRPLLERSLGARGTHRLVTVLAEHGWVVWDEASVPSSCFEDRGLIPELTQRWYDLHSKLTVRVERNTPLYATVWVGSHSPDPYGFGGSQEYHFAWVMGRWFRLPFEGDTIVV
jgi:hypothetical protein